MLRYSQHLAAFMVVLPRKRVTERFLWQLTVESLCSTILRKVSPFNVVTMLRKRLMLISVLLTVLQQ